MKDKRNALTPRDAKAAERCNTFVCVVSATALLGMFGGMCFATTWMDLVAVAGLTAWSAVGIFGVAFIAGVCGGRRHG